MNHEYQNEFQRRRRGQKGGSWLHRGGDGKVQNVEWQHRVFHYADVGTRLVRRLP